MLNLDTLRTLAEAANRHLADEYSLHGFSDPPTITPGMVRCVQLAIQHTDTPEKLPAPPQVQLAARVEEAYSHHPVDGVPARQGDTVGLDSSERGQPDWLSHDEQGVMFAPLPADDPEAPALAAVAAQVRAEKQDHSAAEERARQNLAKAAAAQEALMQSVYTKLREIAVDGVMPSQTEWNAQRGTLPHSATLYATHKITWPGLAEAADLKSPARGRAAKRQGKATPEQPAAQPQQEAEAAPKPGAGNGAPPAEAPTTPHLPWDAEKRRQVMSDIIFEMRLMAEDETMPDEATWNANKPANLPNAQTIRIQWEITWDELARWAKLEPLRRGKKHTKRAAIVRTDARNGANRPTVEAA